MNKFNVSKKQLQALLKTAGKNDVRFYLNGVLADFDNKRLVSTDGHIMLFLRCDDMQGEGEVIISRDQIESICKLGGAGKKTFEPTVAVECDGDKVMMTHAGTEIVSLAVDGRFPDAERIVPKKFTGVPSQIQGRLYGLAEQALLACAGLNPNGTNYVHTCHNGAKTEKDSPGACVMFMPGYDKAFIVVMPFRPNDELKYAEGCARGATAIIVNTMGGAS